MAKLIFSILSVINKLLRLFQNWNIRRQIWKSYHNEQIAKQQEKLRRAAKARRNARRAAADQPDQRLQDDGYRRD